VDVIGITFLNSNRWCGLITRFARPAFASASSRWSRLWVLPAMPKSWLAASGA